MTEAEERDSVQDQLCARIEELEAEKMELNEQLDIAQQERDALSAKVEAIKAEAKDWKACAQNWEANAKQWDDDWHTVKKERDALISRITNREGLVQRAIEKEAQHDALTAHYEVEVPGELVG